MKTIFEVDITNLKVDDHYFSFNYEVLKNGKLTGQGEYSNDHSWGDDKKSFRKMLQEGYAAQLALEQL